MPFRSNQGANHIGFRAEQRNIHRVAGNATGRVGDARAIEQFRMTVDLPFPSQRNQHVSSQEIEQQDYRCESKATYCAT
jgi:hypothetical protein